MVVLAGCIVALLAAEGGENPMSVY